MPYLHVGDRQTLTICMHNTEDTVGSNGKRAGQRSKYFPCCLRNQNNIRLMSPCDLLLHWFPMQQKLSQGKLFYVLIHKNEKKGSFKYSFAD